MIPLHLSLAQATAPLDMADRIARMGSVGILALITVVLVTVVVYLAKENTRLHSVIHADLEKNKTDLVESHSAHSEVLAEERRRHEEVVGELNGLVISRLEALTEATRSLRDTAERMEAARDSFTANSGTPVHGVPAPKRRGGV